MAGRGGGGGFDPGDFCFTMSATRCCNDVDTLCVGVVKLSNHKFSLLRSFSSIFSNLSDVCATDISNEISLTDSLKLLINFNCSSACVGLEGFFVKSS